MTEHEHFVEVVLDDATGDPMHLTCDCGAVWSVGGRVPEAVPRDEKAEVPDVVKLFRARADGLRYVPPICRACGQGLVLRRRFNSGNPIIHYEAPCGCDEEGLPRYPYESGDVMVLGPEVFGWTDPPVICWKGRNFVPQDDPPVYVHVEDGRG